MVYQMAIGTINVCFLDDQNRNRQIMPQNAVVVESYSSNHASPLSFGEDVLDGDIIGMSKSDKVSIMLH